MVEGDRKRDFYEAARIQYYLDSQEYNIIFSWLISNKYEIWKYL